MTFPTTAERRPLPPCVGVVVLDDCMTNAELDKTASMQFLPLDEPSSNLILAAKSAREPLQAHR